MNRTRWASQIVYRAHLNEKRESYIMMNYLEIAKIHGDPRGAAYTAGRAPRLRQIAKAVMARLIAAAQIRRSRSPLTPFADVPTIASKDEERGHD